MRSVGDENYKMAVSSKVVQNFGKAVKTVRRHEYTLGEVLEMYKEGIIRLNQKLKFSNREIAKVIKNSGLKISLLKLEEVIEDFLENNKIDIFLYHLNIAAKNHGFTVEDKLKIINEMKDHLTKIEDKVLKTQCIRQLSEELDVDEETVIEKLEKKETLKSN